MPSPLNILRIQIFLEGVFHFLEGVLEMVFHLLCAKLHGLEKDAVVLDYAQISG